MKAWRLEKAGGRLSLDEVPVPALRPGSALVRLSAAPVLSYMGDVLSGKFATIYRFPDHAFTPGTNGAGTVEAVGPAVFTSARASVSSSIRTSSLTSAASTRRRS